MVKHLVLTSLAVALVVNVGHALDNPTSKIIIPVNSTNPADGKQMFNSYCAPCHGVDGRGHGPVSKSLNSDVADLTILARANKGKFPASHAYSLVQFGDEHKSSTVAMPAWGKIFAHMPHVGAAEPDQRASNLVQYIQTLQEK